MRRLLKKICLKTLFPLIGNVFVFRDIITKFLLQMCKIQTKTSGRLEFLALFKCSHYCCHVPHIVLTNNENFSLI